MVRLARRTLALVVLAAFAAAAPPATSTAKDDAGPIVIQSCSGGFQSSTNPNLKVGISFLNTGGTDAVTVKFDILLLDASETTLETQTESIHGKFSPDTLIQPRRAPFTDMLLTQPEYPDSPAWIVPNHHGTDVTHVRCQLHSVDFADGTSWSATQ